jgi:hypothetical protein
MKFTYCYGNQIKITDEDLKYSKLTMKYTVTAQLLGRIVSL